MLVSFLISSYYYWSFIVKSEILGYNRNYVCVCVYPCNYTQHSSVCRTFLIPKVPLKPLPSQYPSALSGDNHCLTAITIRSFILDLHKIESYSMQSSLEIHPCYCGRQYDTFVLLCSFPSYWISHNAFVFSTANGRVLFDLTILNNASAWTSLYVSFGGHTHSFLWGICLGGSQGKLFFIISIYCQSVFQCIYTNLHPYQQCVRGLHCCQHFLLATLASLMDVYWYNIVVFMCILLSNNAECLFKCLIRLSLFMKKLFKCLAHFLIVLLVFHCLVDLGIFFIYSE